MPRFSRLRAIAWLLAAIVVIELFLYAFSGHSKTANKDDLQAGSWFGAGARSNKSKGNRGHEPINNQAESDDDTSDPNTLEEIIANFSKPWVANETRRAGIRRKLNSVRNAVEYTVLTKNFTVPGQNLTFAINPSLVHNLTDEVYQMLPEQSLFTTAKLKRCSVVGNGGILASSYCGKEIDSSDFVFRCNTPPLKGYQVHTGFKTDLTSINPSGVISAKYKRLSDIGHRNRFLSDMKAYGDLLVPLYGVNMHAYRTSMLALRLLRQKGSATRGLIINPDHFRGLQNMWRALGLRSRMTSGFYLASVALSVCDSVDIYGFWPFTKGPNHRPVTYHYYERLKIPKGVHNFNWEFDTLYRLHMSGVLHLHAGPCVN